MMMKVNCMLYMASGTIGPILLGVVQYTTLLDAWREGLEVNIDIGTEGTVYINTKGIVVIKAKWMKAKEPIDANA